MDAFLSSFFHADDNENNTTKETEETETATSKNNYSSDQCPSLVDLSSSSSSSSSSLSTSSSSFRVDSSAGVDGDDASNSNNTSSSTLSSSDNFNGDYSLSVLLPKRNKTKMLEGYSSASSFPSSDDIGNDKSYHHHHHRHDFELTTIDELPDSDSDDGGGGGDVLFVAETESGQQQKTDGDVVTPKTNMVNNSRKKKKKKKKKNFKKEKKNRRVSCINDSKDGDQPSLAVPITDAIGSVAHNQRVKKKKKKLKAAAPISSSSPQPQPQPPSTGVSSQSSKQSIRKSSSGDSNRIRDFSSRKLVSFFPRVRIHRVPKRCHLSDELMDAIWYSSHDFRSFRQDCYDTMHRMMKLDNTTANPILDGPEDDHGYDFSGSAFSSSSSLPSIFFDKAGTEYCRRGLELRVGGQQDGRQRRKKKVRDIVSAQQTFDDVTGMETDPIFLASLLRPHSKACVELAIKAAECDAEEACLIHFEGMNDQEKRKL